MADIKNAVIERLDSWERSIHQALDRTYVWSERRRFQTELSQLMTLRGQLGRLAPEELRTVHENLSRDPETWIAQRKAS
jgi:hypothetical protein